MSVLMCLRLVAARVEVAVGLKKASRDAHQIIARAVVLLVCSVKLKSLDCEVLVIVAAQKEYSSLGSAQDLVEQVLIPCLLLHTVIILNIDKIMDVCNLPSLKLVGGIGSKYGRRLVSSKASVEAGPSTCLVPSIGPKAAVNECLLGSVNALDASGC